MGLAGEADVASMEYEPVVRYGDELPVDVAGKGQLRLQGCLAAGGETDALGDAEYVGVNGHLGLVEGDGGYDVSRLAPYAGELHEFLGGLRHFAAEPFDKGLRHSRQVARLVVGI